MEGLSRGCVWLKALLTEHIRAAACFKMVAWLSLLNELLSFGLNIQKGTWEVISFKLHHLKWMASLLPFKTLGMGDFISFNYFTIYFPQNLTAMISWICTPTFCPCGGGKKKEKAKVRKLSPRRWGWEPGATELKVPRIELGYPGTYEHWAVTFSNVG